MVLAPRLPKVAVTDPVRFFPADAPNRRAAAALGALFPGAEAASQIVVVCESADGSPIDGALAKIAELAERLRALPADLGVRAVLAPSDGPVPAQRLISPDGLAALIVLRLSVGFASEEASRAVARVEDALAAERARSPTLRLSLTGDATLGRDYLLAIEEGARRSALATVALVAATLLLVYRAPVAAGVSLATLGAAIAVSIGAVVLAAQRLPVAFQSRGFLVALVWGVGTDYCLLLFARVREELRRAGRREGADAVRASVTRALRHTAPVLVTSALAVVLACALMGLARFGLYAFTGPVLALGVAVTLAAVLTLAPALMTLVAGGLFWPPSRVAAARDGEAGAPPARGQLWPAIARLVVRRPVPVLLAGLAAVAPLALWGLRVVPSFELELDIPQGSPSEEGFSRLLRHFDPAQVSPLIVAVVLPAGGSSLQATDALDGIYQLTELLAAEPGVARVWSATRPTGEPGLLARATLRSQLAELESGLGQAERGAGTLAGGLAGAGHEVAQGRAELAERKAALDEEQKHSLLGAFAPDRFAEARRELEALADRLTRLEKGLGEATRGARALEDGMGRGRARLRALDHAPGSARLLDRLALTPEDVAGSAELQRALGYYLSADGRAARFELQLATPPNAPASVDTAARIQRALAVLLPALGFGDAEAFLGGPTAITRDLAAMSRADMDRFDHWIVAGVFVLLAVLLRGVATPAAITAFILLSYFAALGALRLLVEAGVWPGLDWKAPFFLFVLLAAIGADYGVFVLGRAREEARVATFRAALVRALEATGPVVTSCGVVLAGTFATLLLSRIAFLEQVGLGLTVGVLIDTGLVRPFLLPAAALLLQGENG